MKRRLSGIGAQELAQQVAARGRVVAAESDLSKMRITRCVCGIELVEHRLVLAHAFEALVVGVRKGGLRGGRAHGDWRNVALRLERWISRRSRADFNIARAIPVVKKRRALASSRARGCKLARVGERREEPRGRPRARDALRRS